MTAPGTANLAYLHRTIDEAREAITKLRHALDHIERALNARNEPQVGRLEPAEIVAAVAQAADLTYAELIGRRRFGGTVGARQLACALVAEQRPDLSLREVGAACGYHDHTTVSYTIDRAAELRLEPRWARVDARARELIAQAQRERTVATDDGGLL